MAQVGARRGVVCISWHVPQGLANLAWWLCSVAPARGAVAEFIGAVVQPVVRFLVPQNTANMSWHLGTVNIPRASAFGSSTASCTWCFPGLTSQDPTNTSRSTSTSISSRGALTVIVDICALSRVSRSQSQDFGNVTRDLRKCGPVQQ